MGDGTTARIHEQRIEYRAGDATFVGYLAAAEADGPPERPGILVFPEWWGLTEFPRQRAYELSGRGYVALAADMYGDGATTVEQAAEWSRRCPGTGPRRRRAPWHWQFVSYGGAVHSFSNPTADDAGIEGVAYHEPTARRSWSHHLTFLEGVLA